MATMERDAKTAQQPSSTSKELVPLFPVRKRLATPTDLADDAVEAVTNALNHLIADTFALYVKTKNYHWHLVSSHFRDYHLLFDEQADQLLASVDPMAERVRRIGGTTIRSISHIADLQSIVDDNDALVSAEEMIENLLTDNRAMAGKQRAAIKLTEEKRDFPTSNLLQELLDETEKRVWFLYETSMGDESAE